MYKIENIEKDPDDKRDFIASFSSHNEFNYDLVNYVREIEQQGSIGSCVGHAGVSAMELITYKDGLKHNFSRLFAYYNVRLIDNRVGKEGAYLRSILKSISKWGLPDEDLYPYVEKLQDIRPSRDIYESALDFRVTKYERVPLTKESIKGAIDAGYPIVYSMYLFNDFYDMPSEMDASYYTGGGKDEGGHAMVIVGYDKDGIILENSWGKHWGDDGMCAVSWEILDKDGKDAWIATDYHDVHEIIEPVKPKPKPEPKVKPRIEPEPKQNALEKFIDAIFGLFKGIFNLFKGK